MVNQVRHEQIVQELEEKYLQSDQEYFEFVKDGPSNWKLYEESFPRLSFLVKEARNSYHPSTPNQYMDTITFMGNILRWANYIKSYFENTRVDLLPEFGKISLDYDSIAIVEVKKINQENRYSSYGDIIKFAHEDSDYLRAQIESLDPHVIVCCGTLDALDIIYDWNYGIESKLAEFLSKSVWQIGNRLAVGFCHPSIFPSHLSGYPHKSDYNTYSDLDNLFQNQLIKEVVEGIINQNSR